MYYFFHILQAYRVNSEPVLLPSPAAGAGGWETARQVQTHQSFNSQFASSEEEEDTAAFEGEGDNATNTEGLGFDVY
jgi:hypothetical protein